MSCRPAHQGNDQYGAGKTYCEALALRKNSRARARTICLFGPTRRADGTVGVLHPDPARQTTECCDGSIPVWGENFRIESDSAEHFANGSIDEVPSHFWMKDGEAPF